MILCYVQSSIREGSRTFRSLWLLYRTIHFHSTLHRDPRPAKGPDKLVLFE